MLEGSKSFDFEGSQSFDFEGSQKKKLKMILFFGGASCSKCHFLLPIITKLVNETYQYRDIGMEYIDCEL